MNKPENSTILIVDDQLVGRQLMESILYNEGYNLIFAEDGHEALDKANEFLPDVILLDIMMPKLDGFDVCKKIRKDMVLQNVPIILVTALDDRDSKIRGFEAGGDDYVTKPIDRLELLARVRNITHLNRYKKIISNAEEEETGNDLKGKKQNENESVEGAPASANVNIKKAGTPSSTKYIQLIQSTQLITSDRISEIFPEHFIYHKINSYPKSSGIWLTQLNEFKILFLSKIIGEDSNAGILDTVMLALLKETLLGTDEKDPSKILNLLTFNLGNLIKNESVGNFSKENLEVVLCVLNIKTGQLLYSGVNTIVIAYNAKGWNENTTQQFSFNFSTQQDRLFSTHSRKLNPGDKICIIPDSNKHVLEHNKLVRLCMENVDRKMVLLGKEFEKIVGKLPVQADFSDDKIIGFFETQIEMIENEELDNDMEEIHDL